MFDNGGKQNYDASTTQSKYATYFFQQKGKNTCFRLRCPIFSILRETGQTVIKIDDRGHNIHTINIRIFYSYLIYNICTLINNSKVGKIC